MSSLPTVPPNLNGIKNYLEMANDYDMLAPISYWCRLFALKQGFYLRKVKEDVYFLNDLIEGLQTFKPKLLYQKGITNETDAQHYIQSVAKHLHDWADSEVNLKHYNKNVVKAYYSAYMLFNVCSVFEELHEDVSQKAQHAKLMAAQVQNCLNQDVGSSVLSRAKEVLNSYLKDTLEYSTLVGTNDHKPDVVVELVARFVKSLQQPQEQQPQQPQQVPVSPLHGMPIPIALQSRENSGALRKRRLSNLRIVDPYTNRDILTGEEVPPSAVVAPTTATPPDIVATGMLLPQEETSLKSSVPPDAESSLRLHPKETSLEIKTTDMPLMTDSSQLTRKQRINQRTSRRRKEKKIKEAEKKNITSTKEFLLPVQKAEIEPEIKISYQRVPAPVVDSPKMDDQAEVCFIFWFLSFLGKFFLSFISSPKPLPVVPQSVVEKPSEKPVVAVEIESVVNNKHESSLSPSAILMTPPPTIATDVGKNRDPENGCRGPCAVGTDAAQVPSSLPLVSELPGPTPPIVAPNSSVGGMPQRPHIDRMQGRPTPGNNQFFGRPIRPGVQHIPRPHVAGIRQAVPYPGLNQPVLHVIGDQFNQQGPYLSYQTYSPAYYSPSGNQPPGNVLQQPRGAQQCEKVMTSLPIAATDDGENRTPRKSTSLKYAYKDDQWSPANPEGKKAYDRNFLLDLRNNPASQKKPEGLSCLDLVRGKSPKRRVSGCDYTPPFVEMLLAKAVVEPTNSSVYAKMCQALLTKEVKSPSNSAETTNLRKLLLLRSQKDFEKESLIDVESKKKEIAETEAIAKKKELELELEDLVNSNRKKALKNMRFIGELFKLGFFSLSNMHNSVLRLLGQPEDEDSLECLCVLLTSIGKELETPVQTPVERSTSTPPTNGETVDSYFSTLGAILHQRKISNRIRFMIQDVIELRKNGWNPRREDTNPKTIGQDHRESRKERAEKEKELNNTRFRRSLGSMEDLSRGGRMYERRGSEDRNSNQSRPRDDGCNSGSRFRIPKASGDADKGIISWRQGASSGMSQSGDSGASQGTRSKRYQILEDDYGTQHQSSKAPFARRYSLGDPPQSDRSYYQDYRTMPGATKKIIFPPKDGDRGLDSLRSQNSGFSGRSRSEQSSRENSVTCPVHETAQPSNLSRKESKDVLNGKSTVTDVEIERKSQSLLAEYFANGKVEGAVLDMKEWLHPSTVAKFINQCLLHVLEHNRKQRKATGTLLREMVKRQLFDSSDILKGFTELLQSAEDFIMDIPKFWDYVAELVEPLFEDGVINLNFLPQLSSTLNSFLVGSFVAAVLKELVKAQGDAGAERIWKMWNPPLTSVLPSNVKLDSFLAQHKEFEYLSKSDSVPNDGESVGKSKRTEAVEVTPASQVYLDFQHSLEKYLRDAGKLSTDDVCNWIQKQYVGEVNPAFIRALITAVIESSIDDSKLNNSVLKRWTEVLRRYVDNRADRELQLLYAVQTLVTKRQHPKGLIQGVFETLYDTNVISEEGFESWVSVDDPLEREGKAVCLKMITSFLTWLKEADPTSDEEV